MKIISSLLAVCISGLSFSQTIDVKETNEKFSTGVQPAIATTVYGNSPDQVMSAWKKLMNDYRNETVKAAKGEVFGDNILIKEWGNNPVDIYTVFQATKKEKKEKVVRLFVAVNLGGAYLSSSVDRAKYRDMEKIVRDFAVSMTKKPIEEELKEDTRALEKLQKKGKRLEKDKKSLQKDVENYKERITKTENEIVTKQSELEKKTAEVTAQKAVIDAENGVVSEQSAASKKIYEKLQGQQKDLEKDLRKLKESVTNYQEKIRKREVKIKQNEADQEKKKTESLSQEQKVETTKRRLESVI
jgi:Skp family chaperone for outer membrane proteins